MANAESNSSPSGARAPDLFAANLGYLELLHAGVRGKDVHVTIRAKPSDAWLGGGSLERADKLFAEAESRAGDESVRNCLRKLPLPVHYVFSERYKARLGGTVSPWLAEQFRGRGDRFRREAITDIAATTSSTSPLAPGSVP